MPARKDNIITFLASQLAHTLLAQDPAHGVGNIGFPRPIRPDHGRNTRTKLQASARSKALEAQHFQTFEIHSMTLLFCKKCFYCADNTIDQEMRRVASSVFPSKLCLFMLYERGFQHTKARSCTCMYCYQGIEVIEGVYHERSLWEPHHLC